MTNSGFFINYLSWHYSQAVRDGLRIWRGLTAFLFRFFAVPLHLRTLFSRFERMGESYSRGFVISDWLVSATINTVMRLVGAVLRLVVIMAGLVVTAAAGVFGLLFMTVWIALPAAAVVLWVFGLLLVIGV